MKSSSLPADIDIARAANAQPIVRVADKLGLADTDLEPYGHDKAKISFQAIERLADRPTGKLVLVTAITPTPAGEGKTTTTVGLGDALNRIGRRAVVCLREPSLGPCFGMKGGATGGGYAQVIPMEDINLHFTGDFHAVGTAHNLLAAMIDNHLYHGNALGLDPARISWKRVIDLNDRALRHVVVADGRGPKDVARASGYDITAASEVMAVLCLSRSLAELKERLGRMIIGVTREGQAITASQLRAHGAMTVLLRDALKPNLVQTLENNPAFIHGGPFANIAHGCNSLIATHLALRLAEYTVTEAGFGADLGAEKFFDIKCRLAGLRPAAVVLVVTVRALKMHGGAELSGLATPNAAAVARGLVNLDKHLENLAQFGPPVVVAINAFAADTPEETRVIEQHCAARGVTAVRATHWADGGAGAEDLAHAVVRAAADADDYRVLYPDDLPLLEKVRTVARTIYGADDITADETVMAVFQHLEAAGFGRLPVCLAKTPYSFSTDPAQRGRPHGFEIAIRDVRVAAGAGFVVVLAGNILTMPGLPRVPAAEQIDIDDAGQIVGLS